MFASFALMEGIWCYVTVGKVCLFWNHIHVIFCSVCVFWNLLTWWYLFGAFCGIGVVRKHIIPRVLIGMRNFFVPRVDGIVVSALIYLFVDSF